MLAYITADTSAYWVLVRSTLPVLTLTPESNEVASAVTCILHFEETEAQKYNKVFGSPAREWPGQDLIQAS